MGKLPITKVTLGKVTTDTGVVCKNPIIKLIGYPNVYINCTDTKNGVYELQLPDNVDVKCLTFSVDCNEAEDCRNCEPQLIDVCFCDDAGDCPPCHVCVDGVCEPLCPEDQCLNGECVGCTDDSQCPCNQICINGSCVCPPGQGLCSINSECCKECCSTEDCPPCFVCQGGECIPVDCPDGTVCDPDTGACPVCVTSDQCGINECCVNKECECCEGFVRDNCTGLCVALGIDACRSSSDCNDCYDCTNYDECTGYGVCTMKTCPAGQVFSPTPDGKCCHTPCDCGEPGSCPTNRDVCVEYSANLCICTSCGSCTGGNDCEEGCTCTDTNGTSICVVDCAGTCTNGLDCDQPNCGCYQGECISCSSIDCATDPVKCAQTLGCQCFGSRCREGGCVQNNCQTALDCGLGCTCVNGECVNCDNFSCLTAECSQQEGCACVGNKCVGDPIDCADSLAITKDDSQCEITGTLTTARCCECPPITALLTITSATNTGSDSVDINYNVELFQGLSTDPFDKLDNVNNPTISQNEQPDATFTLSTGSAISQGSTSPGTVSGSINTPTPTSEGINLNFSVSNLRNEANRCDYSGLSASKVISAGDLGVGKTIKLELTSDDCKDPLFTWTKSGTQTFDDGSFRKVYVSGSNNTYVDTVPTDQVESCKNYGLQVDCGCAKSTSKFIEFCNPEFNMEITDCGARLQVLAGDTCSNNEGLEWTLSINGGEYQLTGSPSFLSQTYNAANIGVDKINNASVSLNCDSGNGNCEFSVSSEEIPPSATVDPNCGDNDFSIKISSDGPYAIVEATYCKENCDGATPITETLTPNDDGEIVFDGLDLNNSPANEVLVTFEQCGTSVVNFNFPDCCSKVTITPEPMCDDQSFSFTVTGMCDSFNLTGPNGLDQDLDKEALDSFKDTYDLLVDQTYTIRTKCTDICANTVVKTFTLTEEECCLDSGAPITVSQPAVDGQVSVVIPGESYGGSGNFNVTIVNTSDTNDTETKTGGHGDTIVFENAPTNYYIIIADNDANREYCPVVSTPTLSYTPCNTIAPTVEKNCSASSQKLRANNYSSEKSNCPCLPYKVDLDWVGVQNGNNIDVELTITTPTPTSADTNGDGVPYDDLAFNSSGFTGGAGGTVNIQVGSDPVIQSPIIENNPITFSYTGGTAKSVEITFTSALANGGTCTYSGTTGNFNVGANGAVSDTIPTLTLTSGSGNVSRREVVWFEDMGGGLLYFDRVNTWDPTVGYQTSEDFKTGVEYQAVTVCDCIRTSSKECWVCDADITIGDPDFSASTCGESFTLEITNNHTDAVSVGVDALNDGDISQSTTSVAAGDTTTVTFTGPFKYDSSGNMTVIVTLLGDEGTECDGVAATKTVSITDEIVPSVSTACGGTPHDKIELTLDAGWSFTGTAIGNDVVAVEDVGGPTPYIDATSTSGQFVQVENDGNSCQLLLLVPTTECTCATITNILGSADYGCVGGGVMADVLRFYTPNSITCDSGKVSWEIKDSGGGTFATCAGTTADCPKLTGFTVVTGEDGVPDITVADENGYTLVLTDECGCTGTSAPIKVSANSCCDIPEVIESEIEEVCFDNTDDLTAFPCNVSGSSSDWWHICADISCTNGSLDKGQFFGDNLTTINDLVSDATIDVSAGDTIYFFLSTNNGTKPTDGGCVKCRYAINILGSDDDRCDEVYWGCEGATTGCKPCNYHPVTCPYQDQDECNDATNNCETVLYRCNPDATGPFDACIACNPGETVGCFNELLCGSACQCGTCSDGECTNVYGQTCINIANDTNYVASCSGDSPCGCPYGGVQVTAHLSSIGGGGCTYTFSFEPEGSYTLASGPADFTVPDGSGATWRWVDESNTSCSGEVSATCEISSVSCGNCGTQVIENNQVKCGPDNNKCIINCTSCVSPDSPVCQSDGSITDEKFFCECCDPSFNCESCP